MASDNSWEKAKQVLRETLEIDETRTVWLEGVRTQLQSLASTGISTMPDFTLHNEVHSDNIVLLIGELSKLLTSKLSPYETYLLATSSYLHDIGMFISAGRFNITMLPDLAKNLQVCPNNKCDGGVLYETELKKKTVDHQIRAVHHLISARMIAKDGVAQFHLSNLDIPHIVAICRGHRKADLRGQECDCYQTHPTKFGPVRRDLLAGLLRLADALDFYPDRAPLIDFRERAWDFLSNPVSLKHWLQHSFVNSVYLTHDDQGGNRALECQVSYAVPLDDDLNGQTYENFFQPLLDQLSDELQQGDFNGDKYPPILFESLGIRELKINLSLKPQLGVMGLPEVVVDNIRQSSCKNVLEFINYLEAKVSQEAPSEALVMDRRPEVQAFRTILEGDDPQHRLMLISGDHGQGKTWLMKTFERICVERQIPCFKVDLSANTKVEEVLNGIWQRVGPGNFPSYSEARERVGVMDARPLMERQQELTQYFFTDWQDIENGIFIVLLLDTYEKAAPAMKRWIESEFLEGLSSINHTIVAIGGREWPQATNYWSDHCYRFPLNGVQLKDYREYARQRGIAISEDELVQLHKKWSGMPKLFDEYLNNLSLGL